jgi:hypothetical protein
VPFSFAVAKIEAIFKFPKHFADFLREKMLFRPFCAIFAPI